MRFAPVHFVEQAAQPAVGGIVVETRVPVLFDREALDRQWTGQDPQPRGMRQGFSNVPGEGGDQVAAEQDGGEPQKTGQGQLDPALLSDLLQGFVQQGRAGSRNNANVRFGQPGLE